MISRKRLEDVFPDLIGLDPTGAVAALTYETLKASRSYRPRLRIRCTSCGDTVAHVGYVDSLPLFTSRWPVYVPPGWATTDASGEPRTLADYLAAEDLRLGAGLAASLDGKKVHLRDDPIRGRWGVVAVLTLPAAVPQVYPDLEVRCARRPRPGAVLDRVKVIARLRRTPERVDPAPWPIKVCDRRQR